MSESDEFENVSVLLFHGDDEDTSTDNFDASTRIASKPIPMRNRSLSYSAPVDRDVYKAIAQSPATTYLAEFAAHRDDTFGPEGFSEGKVVGNYLVGPIIGGGGFAQCRQAYVINRSLKSKLLPEKVALKIITDPRYFRDFDAEVSIWRRMHHPNILPLIDYCVGPNFKIAVSPLIEGGTLQELLTQRGKLDEEEAKNIFRSICTAIHYMHNECRIAHLDIKLENVLILPDVMDESNESSKYTKIFICDFGLSFCADDKLRGGNNSELMECTDQFCSGSITSLPPEVLSSEASSTSENYSLNSFEQKKKQDIWALGVLLYALVCGRLPFYDQFMPRLQHSIITGNYQAPPGHISSILVQLIHSLLNIHAEERPSITDIVNHIWFVNK